MINNNLQNKAGFFGRIHGKFFEILSIITFTLGTIILAVNLGVTEWFFKQSHYLISIEIILLVLNVLCLSLIILLRYWRSNGSILNTNYCLSYLFSIIVICLVIINLLGSICEDILFYFVYYIIAYDENKEKDEKYLDMVKIYQDIMNNQEKSRLLSDDDDEEKEEKKLKVLKVLPWISFNLNIFFQILGIIFIIFIFKRIKYKSDFGIAPDALTQNGSVSNRNVINADNSNINSNVKVSKKEKRKSRKSVKKIKKSNSVTGKEILSNAESEQIEINKKARKKRGSKRRSKSKDKRKSK